MTPVTGKRAVIYGRVSTEEQKKEGVSIEVQVKHGKTVARLAGLKVVDTFLDEGRSGRQMGTNPGLKRALAMIHNGDAEVLIVQYLDRLGRDAAALPALVLDVMDKGGMVMAGDFVADPHTAMGRYILRIMAANAGLVSDTASERTIHGMEQARANGAKIGRPRFYPNALMVRASKLLSEGKNYTEIAAIFQKERIPTAKGGKWQYRMVSEALNAWRKDGAPVD